MTPLPWQLDRWRKLVELQDSGRLPHALLLSGPRGIGKQPLADALIALARGRTMIVATHDPALAARLDRVVQLGADAAEKAA